LTDCLQLIQLNGDCSACYGGRKKDRSIVFLTGQFLGYSASK